MLPWNPEVPVAVNLRRMFPSASFVGCGDIRTLHATDRSFECRPNSLFAVIRGQRADGHRFINDAIQRGATALLVDRPQAEAPVPQCVVPDVRRCYAELCSALMSDPARRLGLVGVTGTNGKTTVTWLVRSILQAAGKRCGLLGTIEYDDGVQSEKSHLTTPDSKSLASWLGAMVARRTTHAALEMSSHALDQRRAAGTLLDVGIITNITQDHFDYHHGYDAYRQSKLRIFDALKPAGMAIVNVDDPGSHSCLEFAPKRVLTYGLNEPGDLTALLLEEGLSGSVFRLMVGGASQIVRTHLIGRHNVSNCLAAAAAALHFGVPLADIAAGIEALQSVPGRMETVQCGQPFNVFVDYSHTDDALRRCIQFIRRFTPGRVIVVFGAGGDRDRSKRPLLAQAASHADLSVVTSDNPRSEDPLQIIHDVTAGFADSSHVPHIEVDREQAIQWALGQAVDGDTVLIAGKGHETEQIIGAQRRRFDDRQVAAEYLRHGAPELLGPHHGSRNRVSL